MSADRLKSSIEDLARLGQLAYLAHQIHQNSRKKRLWARRWISKRPKNVPLYREITVEDRQKFFANFRLYPEEFNQLLSRLEPRISKQTTRMREPISAKLRLQVTLRYLSSGASFSLLEDIFRIPKNTLSKIIPDVCENIWQELNKECINLPQTADEWKQRSQEFLDMWQYPFALGAIDGKHCEVQAFGKSGSLFYNYKGRFSIILFAVVDAKYRFMFVEVGRPGSVNDASVWQSSHLKKALDEGLLNLPNQIGLISHHFIGDEIFPLQKTLLKPFSRATLTGVKEKIFNYRLSRARRVVENAFGIMASRFRVLRQPILQNYENAIQTVKACTVLHNYCVKFCNQEDAYLNNQSLKREIEGGTVTPGNWENDTPLNNLRPLGQLAGNRFGTHEARLQRDLMAEKFVTDNLAPWQFKQAYIV